MIYIINGLKYDTNEMEVIISVKQTRLTYYGVFSYTADVEVVIYKSKRGRYLKVTLDKDGNGIEHKRLTKKEVKAFLL